MERNPCCKMSARFLIAIVAEDPDYPVPVDLVDFIVDWDNDPPVIHYRFCPFCGKTIDIDLTDLRVEA